MKQNLALLFLLKNMFGRQTVIITCFPCIYTTSLCHSLHKMSQSVLFNSPVPNGTLSPRNLSPSPHFWSLRGSQALESVYQRCILAKGLLESTLLKA